MEYFVLLNGDCQKLSLRELVSYCREQDPNPMIWSARLSTGLFGWTSCASGNKGPKSYSEILLALGDGGLRKLVDLGFITCPSCHPENVDGFWSILEETVRRKYNIESLEDFTNKEILSFDARRVRFEEFLPVIGKSPNRLYVPKELKEADLVELKKRFDRMEIELPPVGYYDINAPGRFKEYTIPV